MAQSFKEMLEKIKAQFLQRKLFFKDTLERWKKQGHQAYYAKGTELFTYIVRHIEDLEKTCVSEAGQASHNTMQRLKALKNAYKELHEITKPTWRQWLEAISIALVAAVILRNCLFSLYHVPTGSAEPTILVGDRLWGNKTAYFFSDVKRGDYVILDNPEQGYDERNYLTYLWSKYVGLSIPFLGIKSGPINVTKRVIAVPGDTIEGRIEDGKTVIYLNGAKLDEPYVNRLPLIYTRKTTGVLPAWLPLTIPFLSQETKKVRYTYDPAKPFDQQPYYQLNANEVITYPGTGSPVLWQPFSPSAGDFGTTIDRFGPFTVPQDMYWMMGDSRKNSRDCRSLGYFHKKYIHGRVSFIMYSIDSEEPLWLFEFIKHPISFWTQNVRWNRFFKNVV